MIEIPLGKHSKARVWLEEQPSLVYRAAGVAERVVGAGRSARSGNGRVAEEALIARGGRAQCGLLGADFVPRGDGQLVVRVSTCGREGPPVEGEGRWPGSSTACARALPASTPPPSSPARCGGTP
jgi:hypothetical protein